MCRIAILRSHGDTTMTHGGTKTEFKKGSSGNILTHHWLPIQTTGQGSPFIDCYDGANILFNGEVFNHSFDNDMDAIKFAYEGSELAETEIESLSTYMFSEVDGFFSILADTNRYVYAMVDPLGKKQLYYKEGYGIASEIKALLTGSEVFNDSYFSRTIKFGYVTDDSTPYEGIYRLPPNSIYVFDKELRLVQKLLHVREICKVNPQEHNFHARMATSVINRTVSKLPIALLLSGGLDSSILCYHLKEIGANFTSYCVDNEEDVEFARLMDPDVKILPSGGKDFLPALMSMEQPLDLGSMVPQYSLLKGIKETVVLTGDGADELFGGYKRSMIYDSQLSDIFDELVYYHHIRLDRMAAIHTKEIRSPFLNLDILEYALGLPYDLRQNKFFLRSYYSPFLPKEIINRGKEPLKTNQVRTEDPVEYRAKLSNTFKEIIRGKQNLH